MPVLRREGGGRMSDPVSSPFHYTGPIECKDAMKAAIGINYCTSLDRKADFNIPPIAFYWWGCAFKYLWRWSRKNGVEDLRKCQQCIDFLIDEVGE